MAAQSRTSSLEQHVDHESSALGSELVDYTSRARVRALEQGSTYAVSCVPRRVLMSLKILTREKLTMRQN
jgi:hypothetical protein